MQKSEKTLEKVAETLERYRKNKTMLNPDDLRGKYRDSFQRLTVQLRNDLQEYLKEYCMDGIFVRSCDCMAFAAECSRVWAAAGFGKKVAQAVFVDFDLAGFQRLAGEFRAKLLVVWRKYFNSHTCVYAYSECFTVEKPHVPLIYNRLAGKFWDEKLQGWVSREKPPGGAVLIFVGGEK